VLVAACRTPATQLPRRLGLDLPHPLATQHAAIADVGEIGVERAERSGGALR